MSFDPPNLSNSFTGQSTQPPPNRPIQPQNISFFHNNPPPPASNVVNPARPETNQYQQQQFRPQYQPSQAATPYQLAQWAQYMQQWQQWYNYQQHMSRFYVPVQSSVQLPPQQQPPPHAPAAVTKPPMDARLNSMKYDARKRIAANGGTRFSDSNKSDNQSSIAANRSSRFESSNSPVPVTPKRVCVIDRSGSDVVPAEIEDDETKIVGLSDNLEKSYFRLTSEADPLNIRPLPVLQRSFEFVLKKARDERNQHEIDREYLSDQLRSIRQDLTVQNIKTAFTTRVYETNAVIALEMGDREEFNQCQTQLVSLYDAGLDIGNARSFIRLRLLYNMFIDDKAGSLRALNLILSRGNSLTQEDELCIRLYQNFTLQAFGNFFRLYASLDEKHPIRHLIDIFASHYRRTLLLAIFKTMRPKVSVDYLKKALGFSDDQSCLKLLAQLKVHWQEAEDGSKLIECRPALSGLVQQ